MLEQKMCELRESSSSINSDRQQAKNSIHSTSSREEVNSTYSSTRHQEEVRKEREARSLALEKAYVHDVYEQISANFSDSRYRPWPRVKQFLMDLEPGSFVCDVGCGSGKYLSINPLLFNAGADRCRALTELAREKEHEVLICDNLSLPYKDESFDAVLSIAVIHHIATTERRVRALRELARILRVGGKIIISVWSMEQRRRQFESQDVLIPWSRPTNISSEEKTGSSGVGDTTTTTCTSEDDVTHYHAYTQTGSDSEPLSISRLSMRRKGRSRHKGRSISPSGGRSSSDLSSPNESCYSFVRKALQKFATHKKQNGGAKLPWFFHNLETYYAKEMEELGGTTTLFKGDSGESNDNEDLPIEIRHLEEEFLMIPPLVSDDKSDIQSNLEESLSKSRSLNDLSQILVSAERRKLGELGRSVTCDDPTATSIDKCTLGNTGEEKKPEATTRASTQSVQSTEGSGSWFPFLDRSNHWSKPSFGSLSSLSSAKSAISALSSKSDSVLPPTPTQRDSSPKSPRIWNSDSQLGADKAVDHEPGRRKSELSRHLAASLGAIQKSRNLNLFKSGNLSSAAPEKERSKAMQTIEGKLMVAIKEVNENDGSENSTPVPSPGVQPPVTEQPLLNKTEKRPTLVKQKKSIQAFSFPPAESKELTATQHYLDLRRELNPRKPKHPPVHPTIQITQFSHHTSPQKTCSPSSAGSSSSSTLHKQVSMNDELFFQERKQERDAIREKIQRQQSLPCHNSGEETTRKPAWVKEGFLSATQYKQFDAIRDKFSKLRDANSSKGCHHPPADQQQLEVNDGDSASNNNNNNGQKSSSFTHGLVKILHRWKSEQTEGGGGGDAPEMQASFTRKKGVNIDPIMVFGLRRDQSLDSATRRGLFHKKGAWSPKSPKLDSGSPLENQCLLSPTVRRCCMECPDDNGVVERRLSRGETGSDSSKDSSIQSDTSLDSEDSCISVIYVPHPELKTSQDGANKQSPQSQRSTSNSSESSESPTGRGSPMSPGSKVLSPSKMLVKCKNSKLATSDSHTDISRIEEESSTEIKEMENGGGQPSCSTGGKVKHCTSLSTLPRIPEHKSFELEDLPNENPINCHPLGIAERVESLSDSLPPLSPLPSKTSKFDYPIVKHHPLFAKTHKVRGGISSLLLGENIEFMRKPGQSSSEGVQTVRKTTPKLLTFEIYNPETDDLDSDTSLSSSPDSEESVVSVISDSTKSVVPPGRKTSVVSRDMSNDEDTLNEDEQVFKFDADSMEESQTDTVHASEEKEEEEENSDSSMEDSILDLKSEMRKRELINLLGENKSVFQGINESQSVKSTDIESIVLKTTSQLQSMEELHAPGASTSESVSPISNPSECRSEPVTRVLRNISQEGSLDSINSISDVKSDEESGNSNNVEETKAAVKKEKPRKDSLSQKVSLLRMKQLGKKIDDEVMPEIVISEASDLHSNEGEVEADVNVENAGSTSVESASIIQKESEEKPVETATIEIDKEKSMSESPSPKSLDEKIAEIVPKPESESQAFVPVRKVERKKRDDSLDSNTPSVKSSIYHSDTGSILSHRFSTVSISSNVSSDVSFGNNSGVSGSSCYLASMSSADFDDRPPLASSFSLSEAEENEYLSSQPVQQPSAGEQPAKEEQQQKTSSDILPQVKKDHLSPPKPEVKSQDRPKLKSLFKRNSDSKSRSSSHESRKSVLSSYESRSRDGTDDGNGSKPRSRIGSSLTPDTSVEQTTCVEKCSSSFEEEMLRSFNKEDNEKDNDSGSDSEDSAEAGGSLTHHRYYHVFREGEIDHIIEKYVENLHIISSYYDHANWCIIAEKVNVWTI